MTLEDRVIQCMMVFAAILMVGMIIVLYLLISHLVFGFDTLSLKCVVYVSDKLAVITVSYSSQGPSGNCDDHARSISYFLYQGYNITAASELEVYMTK